MKKKHLNILLIASILLIWGYIVKEVFVPTKIETEASIVSLKKISSTKTESIVKYKLMANYPDPFKMKSRWNSPKRKLSSTKSKKRSAIKRTNRKSVKKKPTWPTIEFKGRIKNNSSSASVALLKVDGKRYRLTKNEVVNLVTINSIWKDSVLLVFEDERKVYTLK